MKHTAKIELANNDELVAVKFGHIMLEGLDLCLDMKKG